MKKRCCIVPLGSFLPPVSSRDLLGLVAGLAAALDLLQDGLAVLVELELGHDDLAGVDADGDALAVGLVAGDAVDVDDVLEAVDRVDLALTALEGATDDGDLVVLADGDAADLRGVSDVPPKRREQKETYVVLLTELLAEGGAHDDAADAGGGREVRLARLPAGRVNTGCISKVSTSIRLFGLLQKLLASLRNALTPGNHFVDWLLGG